MTELTRVNVGNAGYGNNQLILYYELISQSVESNTSKVKFRVSLYCPVYVNTTRTTLNIMNVISQNVGPNFSAGEHVLGEVTWNLGHDDLGKLDYTFWASISSTYLLNGTASAKVPIPNIPRYANLTSLSVQSATETSITLKYTTDKPAWLFARINDDDWLNGGGAFVSNTTSGTFTIKYKDRASTKSLDPNTTYKITVLCRALNHDSGIDTSKQISGTTYDYPHITAVNTSNLTIGNSQKLTLYNPLSRTVTIKMNKDSASGTQLYSGTTNSTSITFTPTASTLYASIPSSKNAKCVYSAIYSTSTKTTSQYTYSINETNCKPTFSNFSYEDINSNTVGLTNNNQLLVDGYSNCKVTVSTSNRAIAKNGASISKYIIYWGNSNLDLSYSSTSDVSSSITGSGNIVKVTAVDSRGLSTTITKTINNISYSKPIIESVSTQRSDGVNEETHLNLKISIWNGKWDNSSRNNSITFVGYKVKMGSGSYSDVYDITSSFLSKAKTYESGQAKNYSLDYSDNLQIHSNGSSDGFSIGTEYDIQLLIRDGYGQYYVYTLTGSTFVSDGKVGLSRFKDSDGNYHYGINGMPSSDCTLIVKGNTNIDGDVNLVNRANAVNINGHKGILKHWTNDTQICANDGVIYLRPKGNENATNQVAINNNGSVKANKFNGQVTTSTGGSYRKARDNATVLNNGYGQSAGNSFNVVASQKTSLGAWSIGNLSGYEDLIFSYNTDTNYKNHSNTCSVVKLPITGGTIQCEPTILYNNSTGTTGTVTLSDSAANYSYLEIFIKNNDNYYQNVKVTDPNNKNVSLTVNTQVGEVVYLKNKTILISGKSISNVSNYYSQVQINASLQLGYSKSNLLYIVKVLGYK